MSPRMKQKYFDTVAEKVKQAFGVSNPMALPRMEKILITVGLGKQLDGTKINPVAKEQVVQDLATISGQKPVMTVAKKSVSNFKVRAGYENGAMVTLRGDRMWEFFDRLLSLTIPRIKDFRGLSAGGFDGQGNFSFGLTEQGVFPEVDMGKAKFVHGMNVTFVFRNSDDEKSKLMLSELGMPFSDKQGQAS